MEKFNNELFKPIFDELAKDKEGIRAVGMVIGTGGILVAGVLGMLKIGFDYLNTDNEIE